MVSALTRAKLQDGYVSYPWERRMQEVLSVPNSSSFLSVLFLPKASDRAASRYNDLEDTLARSNAWLNASQASGVPVVFMNIQTESLLTKVRNVTVHPINCLTLLVYLFGFVINVSRIWPEIHIKVTAVLEYDEINEFGFLCTEF